MKREGKPPKFVTGSKRYQIAPKCPCGKNNKNGKFAPYVGYTDKGYCHSCGETFHPDKEVSLVDPFQSPPIRRPSFIDKLSSDNKKSVIPVEYFEQSINPPSIQTIRANSSLFKALVNNRHANIPKEVIIEAFNRFSIGFTNYLYSFPKDDPTYKSQGGANIFWLIDESNDIRGGQVVLFDTSSQTASTLKKPNRHTRPVYFAIQQNLKKKGQEIPEWLFSYKNSSGNKYPCLFGLPQLKIEQSIKPIALCEAYKTAMIGYIFFPQYIWLAVGSRGWLTSSWLKAINGRTVHLFPDLSSDGGTLKLWEQGAIKLEKEYGGSWIVNRILEDAPGITVEERKAGIDIADYLLTRCNWHQFQKLAADCNSTHGNNNHQKVAETVVLDTPQKEVRKVQFNYTINRAFIKPWDIESLQRYFYQIILPAGPYSFNASTVIPDLRSYVDSQLAIINFYNGSRQCMPHYQRLLDLKRKLENSSKDKGNHEGVIRKQQSNKQLTINF